MQLLSDGDLETEIYHSSQHDEIAAMANSLQIFRESMIAARALSSDEPRLELAEPGVVAALDMVEERHRQGDSIPSPP